MFFSNKKAATHDGCIFLLQHGEKKSGEGVGTINRVADCALFNPKCFFEQFMPLVAGRTSAQKFLDERYRELEELNALREECLRLPNFTVGQLQTLDAMIKRLKRDIAEAEFDERDTVLKFCESGSAIDADGNIWF